MGIYDRDYYRDEPQGFNFGNRPMVINIILVNVAIFIADAFIANTGPDDLGPLMELLALRSTRPRRTLELVEVLHQRIRPSRSRAHPRQYARPILLWSPRRARIWQTEVSRHVHHGDSDRIHSVGDRLLLLSTQPARGCVRCCYGRDHSVLSALSQANRAVHVGHSHAGVGLGRHVGRVRFCRATFLGRQCRTQRALVRGGLRGICFSARR